MKIIGTEEELKWVKEALAKQLYGLYLPKSV